MTLTQNRLSDLSNFTFDHSNSGSFHQPVTLRYVYDQRFIDYDRNARYEQYKKLLLPTSNSMLQRVFEEGLNATTYQHNLKLNTKEEAKLFFIFDNVLRIALYALEARYTNSGGEASIDEKLNEETITLTEICKRFLSNYNTINELQLLEKFDKWLTKADSSSIEEKWNQFCERHQDIKSRLAFEEMTKNLPLKNIGKYSLLEFCLKYNCLIVGSTGLAVQGYDVKVNDLDIIVPVKEYTKVQAILESLYTPLSFVKEDFFNWMYPHLGNELYVHQLNAFETEEGVGVDIIVVADEKVKERKEKAVNGVIDASDIVSYKLKKTESFKRLTYQKQGELLDILNAQIPNGTSKVRSSSIEEINEKVDLTHASQEILTRIFELLNSYKEDEGELQRKKALITKFNETLKPGEVKIEGAVEKKLLLLSYGELENCLKRYT